MSDENIFEEYKRASMGIKSVQVTDDELILEWKNGEKTKHFYKDLKRVSIITTDEGPLSEDAYWLMMFEIIIMIPQGVPGTDKLLERLQKLPDFDNEKVIEAMTCIENNAFHVWVKK